MSLSRLDICWTLPTVLLRDEIWNLCFPGTVSFRNGKIYGMPWLMDVKYFMYNKGYASEVRHHRSTQDLGGGRSRGRIDRDKGIVEFPIIWCSWNKGRRCVSAITPFLLTGTAW